MHPIFSYKFSTIFHLILVFCQPIIDEDQVISILVVSLCSVALIEYK